VLVKSAVAGIEDSVGAPGGMTRRRRANLISPRSTVSFGWSPAGRIRVASPIRPEASSARRGKVPVSAVQADPMAPRTSREGV
jgi:hypothetical protein